MKIKIIKNDPLIEDSSDITCLIGREFDIKEKVKNGVRINEGWLDITIFDGEYEIISE